MAVHAIRWETKVAQHRRGDVDGAHQAAATAASLDVARPSGEERSPDPAVVERRLAARERTAVVADEQDERIPGNPLAVKLRELE